MLQNAPHDAHGAAKHARAPLGVRLSISERTWVRWSVPFKHQRTLRDMPGGLFKHWRATARDEFADLPQSWRAFVVYACGLMDFFACVRVAKGPCALPSKAVDSVWHAWLAYDPAGLEAFCKRHFGRAVRSVAFAKLTRSAPLAMYIDTARGKGRL